MFASFVYLVFFVALISCINKKLECNPSFLGSYFISSYSFLITAESTARTLEKQIIFSSLLIHIFKFNSMSAEQWFG
jgi:hypothetical protein